MTTSSNQSSNKNTFFWVGGGCLAFLTIMFCAVASGVVAYVVYGQYQDAQLANQPTATVPQTAVSSLPTTTSPQSTSPPTQPTATKPADIIEAAPAVPTATPAVSLFDNVPASIEQAPLPPLAHQNLNAMLAIQFPYYDLYEAEARLAGNDLGPRQLDPPVQYQQGEQRIFITDEGNRSATLQLQTELFSFWVDDSLNYSDIMLQSIAKQLETEYYPLLTDFFGEPASPGIDGVPQVSLFHYLGDSGDTQLGYFTSQDAFPRTVFAESNEQEIVYLNMGQLELGSDLYYGTTLHELQHLIQFNIDPNETTWLNEGLAQLAELYLDFDTVEPREYYENPDIRLNTWDYEDDIQQAYYGGSYLFATYLWEQLGETAVRELIRHPANGMPSVHAILQGYRPDLTLDALFADFATAVFLDDPRSAPQFEFRSLNTSRPAYLQRSKDIPVEVTTELNQFATHYIELDFSGNINLSFAGDTQTAVIDGVPRNSDGTFWFAPPMDETNATLQGSFDLSSVRTATLQFSTWYDLERDWDYAYVLVSTDAGATWQVLDADDITSNEIGQFGPAFNGQSFSSDEAASGWVKQSYSLGEFVGQQLLIRFEVQTDYNGLGRGFAIDDITIPEIGFNAASPDVDSRWQPNGGFALTGHLLPQPWHVRLIHRGDVPRVETLTLNELNQVKTAISLGTEGAVLLITTGIPFIAEPADYWLNITK